MWINRQVIGYLVYLYCNLLFSTRRIGLDTKQKKNGRKIEQKLLRNPAFGKLQKLDDASTFPPWWDSFLPPTSHRSPIILGIQRQEYLIVLPLLSLLCLRVNAIYTCFIATSNSTGFNCRYWWLARSWCWGLGRESNANLSTICEYWMLRVGLKFKRRSF